MVPITQRPWLPAVLVTLGGVLVLLIIGLSQSPSVQAQPQFGSGSNISVVAIQIGRDDYGIAMVDRASETIWIYEIISRGPAQSRLRLLAARSWKYDRRLEDLNNAEPRPEQIKLLLESLEEQRKEPNKEQQRGLNILELAEPNSN